MNCASRPYYCAISVLALGLGGCATIVPPRADLSPAKAAEDFSARSLRDPALHRFLAENLGHDPGDAWDFEALSWAAFYYHPSLALARAQWATARAVEHTAGLRPNPTLTFTPGFNSTREPGLSPWMPSINADFLLPTNGKRARQQDIARLDAEASRLAVFSAAWQVRSDLRKALADAAIAARRETLLRAQADVQRNLLRLLEQRYAAGSIAATEVSVTRTALLRAEAAAADALSQALTARARVAAALGVSLASLEGVRLPPAPLVAPLTAEALAAARRESLQSRPDVLAALAKYHGAQAALELEVAKQVPDIHLGPGYQWDQNANKWSLGISFELPVFHRNEAPIAEATARRAEAAAQFNVVQAQAVAAIDAAVAAQGAAAMQLERARQLRVEVEKQGASVQQRLEAGGADQVEVQTARLDLATIDTAILEAENSAAVAAGQLEDALQLPFPHLTALAEAGAPPSPPAPHE
jgi:outer membrane protein, heavy metal efflux system